MRGEGEKEEEDDDDDVEHKRKRGVNNEQVIPEGAHYTCTLYRISHLSSSDSGSDVKTTCKQERSKVSKWKSDSQTMR